MPVRHWPLLSDSFEELFEFFFFLPVATNVCHKTASFFPAIFNYCPKRKHAGMVAAEFCYSVKPLLMVEYSNGVGVAYNISRRTGRFICCIVKEHLCYVNKHNFVTKVAGSSLNGLDSCCSRVRLSLMMTSCQALYPEMWRSLNLAFLSCCANFYKSPTQGQLHNRVILVYKIENKANV